MHAFGAPARSSIGHRPGWRRPPGSAHTPITSGRRQRADSAPAPPGDDGDPSPPLPDEDAAGAAWLMGLEAGSLRGLVAGRRRALQTVLRARFGPLDAAALQRLGAIEPTALDRRLCDAVRADDLESFWRADDPARRRHLSDERG